MKWTRTIAVWVSSALALASCSRAALDVEALAPCPATCDDGNFCNGVEVCDEATRACVAPAVPFTCDDEDECTLDSCDEVADRCDHRTAPRDEDADGYNACDNDCDDRNALVNPGATETCNDIDDDCDRAIDENLVSECNDCRPGCRILELPRDDVRLPSGETGWIVDDSDAVAENSDGALVLNSESKQVYSAWIANSTDGKVTKLDTRDGTQTGFYDSVLLGPDTHPPPPSQRCNDGESSGAGNCPSRTAVDLNGAVYVANRAFGGQGTVTKIAGFREDCVDRNGDGVIQTSEDVNLNGLIDRNIPGEYWGQADECLLWTVDVGQASGGVPRAIAVAGDGTVWVGLHHDEAIIQLDPEDGHQLKSKLLPTFKPYGAAFDRKGVLWLTESLSGEIISYNTVTDTVGRKQTAPAPEAGCPSSYGIAVDADDRVWIAGFTCPYVFRFDPDGRQWRSIAVPGAGVTRGIAASDDGLIFVASSHDWIRVTLSASNPIEASDSITRLTVFNGEDGGNLRVFGTPDDPILGSGSIGVGLDNEGRAWLVNQTTGSATRVDVNSGEVRRFAAGPEPYTYSDFTGYALRRITAPSGFVRSILEGCTMGPTEWERIEWDAAIPAGARLELRARTAATLEGLDAAMWLGPWSASPIDLLAGSPRLPEERYLQIESRLISVNEMSSPRLQNLTVQLHCPL